MKLKNLIGICCILFCILVYCSMKEEEKIIIKEYEWDESMEIVKEYRKMREKEVDNLYDTMQIQ